MVVRCHCVRYLPRKLSIIESVFALVSRVRGDISTSQVPRPCSAPQQLPPCTYNITYLCRSMPECHRVPPLRSYSNKFTSTRYHPPFSLQRSAWFPFLSRSAYQCSKPTPARHSETGAAAINPMTRHLDPPHPPPTPRKRRGQEKRLPKIYVSVETKLHVGAIMVLLEQREKRN